MSVDVELAAAARLTHEPYGGAIDSVYDWEDLIFTQNVVDCCKFNGKLSYSRLKQNKNALVNKECYERYTKALHSGADSDMGKLHKFVSGVYDRILELTPQKLESIELLMTPGSYLAQDLQIAQIPGYFLG